MRKEAFRPKRGLQRLLGGLGWGGCLTLGALALLSGCNDLSEEECLKLRGQAYEIINVQCDGCLPHTCNDDTDCIGTTWPGCIKPVNKKNLEKVSALEKKFKEGSCKEEEQTCPDAPDVYCKQGLCVFRHRPGESGRVESE
jgi:hypothetical protein